MSENNQHNQNSDAKAATSHSVRPIKSIKAMLPLEERLSAAIQAIDAGALTDIRYQLATLSAAEIADLLESTPAKMRVAITEIIHSDEKFSSILSELDTEVRAALLQDMDVDALTAAGHDLDTDDFTDILQELPEAITNQVLASMDARDRARIEQLLSYPEDSAGGLMDTHTITVKPTHKLGLITRYLRRFASLPTTTDLLVVVDDNDLYLGTLPLHCLLTNGPELHVQDVMNEQVEPIGPQVLKNDVAYIFARDNLISAPVVDEAGRLLGRITIDDVVDVIIADADQSLLGLAGVDVEQDTFAPLIKTMRNRGLWLGVNLITACMAAAVIHAFEHTIAELVSLAVLLPVVASMGGVAGTQTLTLIVRGMALHQVFSGNLRWIIGRELLIGLMNSLIWALIIAVGAGFLFQNAYMGFATGIAIAITLATAAVAGVSLPYVLKKLGIDPAIAGGVILTTVTDLVGFLSFLGFATLLLASA